MLYRPAYVKSNDDHEKTFTVIRSHMDYHGVLSSTLLINVRSHDYKPESASQSNLVFGSLPLNFAP